MSSQDGSEKPQNAFALPPELIEALLPNSSAIAVAQGETIFHQADTCRGAFIVRSGRCRLTLQAANGIEVYSRILSPGCILGLPATLCGEVYNTSAFAIDSCELACIDVQTLQEFVRTSPDLSIAIVQTMSRELADMNVRRANLHACKSCGCPLAETCSHHLFDLK